MEKRRAMETASSGGPNKRRRKEHLEILITPAPRFIPGTAPPQPPISLLPARDGDAFIVDKVIHPLELSSDPTVQRKLCYIVGWPNLPAARVIVSCAQALDYLSPYAIEEWEYNDAIKREEAEWEEAIAEAKSLSMPEEGPVEEKMETVRVNAVKRKKKAGRPPKASRLAEDQSPTPALAEEEQELMLAKRAAGPSLSTPQKRRLQQLIAEEEVYEDPDEADILQQLYDEAKRLDPANPMDIDTDEPFPSTDDLQEEDEFGGGSGRRSGDAQAALAEELPALEPPQFPSLIGKGKAPAFSTTTSSANTTPVPAKQPTSAIPPSLPPSSLPKLNGAMSAASSSYGSASLSPHPESATPLALKRAREKRKPGRKPKSRMSTPAKVPPSTTSNGTSHAPTAEPSRPSWGFTPIKPLVANTPQPSYSQLSPSNWQQQDPEDTPFSSKPAKQAKKKSSKQTIFEAIDATAIEPQAPEPEPERPDEGQAWEVLRLEGDRLVEMPDGTKVQYFKVRWEGDWPADQNPSWEPEENISKGIVRTYLKKEAKKAAAKGLTSTPKKSQKTLSSWVLGPKYSSVMDAVEGREDVEAAERSFAQPARDGEDELNGGIEEKIVVTNAPSSAKTRASGQR